MDRKAAVGTSKNSMRFLEVRTSRVNASGRFFNTPAEKLRLVDQS